MQPALAEIKKQLIDLERGFISSAHKIEFKPRVFFLFNRMIISGSFCVELVHTVDQEIFVKIFVVSVTHEN